MNSNTGNPVVESGGGGGADLSTGGNIPVGGPTNTDDAALNYQVGPDVWSVGIDTSDTATSRPFKVARGTDISANERVEISNTGAIRLNSYTAGVLQTDANGNVTAGAGGAGNVSYTGANAVSAEAIPRLANVNGQTIQTAYDTDREPTIAQDGTMTIRNTLCVEEGDGGADVYLCAKKFSDSNGQTAEVLFQRARTNGEVVSDPVLNNNQIGNIRFDGWDGDGVAPDYGTGALIRCRARGTWTATSHPTEIDFRTNLVNESAATGSSRLLIADDGNVYVNGELLINNDVRVFGEGTNNNTIFGRVVATSLSTGEDNTMIGDSAANAITTGSRNTLVGLSAGDEIVSGDDNTYIGQNAGGATNSTLSRNIGIGSGANVTGTAEDSIAIGVGAATSVSRQAVIGSSTALQTLQSCVPGTNGECDLGLAGSRWNRGFFSNAVGLGTLAADPTTGNTAGQIYWNTTTNVIRVFNGTAWTDLTTPTAAVNVIGGSTPVQQLERGAAFTANPSGFPVGVATYTWSCATDPGAVFGGQGTNTTRVEFTTVGNHLVNCSVTVGATTADGDSSTIVVNAGTAVNSILDGANNLDIFTVGGYDQNVMRMALSVRHIRSGYTGPLIQISKGLGTPTDITRDNNGYLSQTQVEAAPVGGGLATDIAVLRWYDQSGNGFHTAVSPNATAPRLQFTNDVPELRFNDDGTRRFLDTTATITQMSLNAEHCISLNARAANTVTTGQEGLVGDTARTYEIFRLNAGNTRHELTGGFLDYGNLLKANTNNYHLAIGYEDDNPPNTANGSIAGKDNGTLSGGNRTNSATGANTIHLGSYATTATADCYQGFIQEILVFNDTVNTASAFLNGTDRASMNTRTGTHFNTLGSYPDI